MISKQLKKIFLIILRNFRRQCCFDAFLGVDSCTVGFTAMNWENKSLLFISVGKHVESRLGKGRVDL